MTDTMIDRVAKALEQRFQNTIAAAADNPFDATGVTSPARRVWVEYAYAAIAAMRDPPDELLEAAGIDNDESGAPYVVDWRMFREDFSNVLSAALEGK